MHFGNRHGDTCGNDGYLEKKKKKRKEIVMRNKSELLGEFCCSNDSANLIRYLLYINSGFKSTLSHFQFFPLARKHWKVASPL